MLLNNKGFTLLEMIIVLLITSIILGISIININHYQAQNDVNQVIKTIGSKFDFLKQYTKSIDDACYLTINDHFIESKCNDHYYEKYKINNKVKIQSNYQNNIIKINAQGHVLRAGKIEVLKDKFKKTLTIGIGLGDYHVK